MPLNLKYDPTSKLLTVTRTCPKTSRIIDILESSPEIVHVHNLGHVCPHCRSMSRFDEDNIKGLTLVEYCLYTQLRAQIDDNFSQSQLAEDHRGFIHAAEVEVEFGIEDMDFEMFRTIAIRCFEESDFKTLCQPIFFRSFTPLRAKANNNAFALRG